MGVTSTYCQICQLPVQHDHYVPSDGYFLIYRGNGEEVAREFDFTDDHAWLKDAIALRLSVDQSPVLLEGQVHDGYIGEYDEDGEDSMVWDGIDQRAALHRACWKIAGQPDIWSPRGKPQADAWIEECRGQLFDFAKFARGSWWKMIDPTLTTPFGERSRHRIEECVKQLRLK